MGKFMLAGSTALVTGASSGIGREIARCLASEGVHCILSALPREEEALIALKHELIESHGIEAWYITSDLSEGAGVETLYHDVQSIAAPLDLLVNNAGIISYGHFHESSLATNDRILSVNAAAYMKLMFLFLPDMIAAGKGRILNVSSVAGLAPTPHHAVYGATKAFVQSLSEAVTQEIKGTGVSIHTLNPGYTDTPMLRGENFPLTLRFYRYTGILKPEIVARKGVAALKRGKASYIPGMRLRLVFSFLRRLVPRQFAAWVSLMMTQ